MIRQYDAAVLVIAKSPQPGRVKTRLCPPCTPRQAADIAASALAHTLATVALAPVSRRVLVLDGPAGAWIPEEFEVIPQVGGDLGVRLAAAFADPHGPLFLVGMDTPQLTVSHVVDAVRELSKPDVDAVLGRAADGGWWGLGMSQPDSTVFEGVPMSTSRTGSRQLHRLRELGLRTRSLPELRDVDRFGDALAVAAELPGSRFAAAVAAVRRSGSLAARAS